MKKASVFSKILVIAGTILVWLPIAFMVVTAVVGSIQAGRILCDYMLPAEAAFVVLEGAAALLWAGIREHSLVRPITWTLGVGILLLAAIDLTAMLSGLANGRLPASKAPAMVAVLTGLLILYDLGVVLMGFWGIRLWQHLYKKQTLTSE